MTTTSDARKRREEATNPPASCAGGGGDVEALVIPRPSIHTGPKHLTVDEATTDYLREAASRVRNNRYWGSGVSALVSNVLDSVAAALASQPAAPQPTEGEVYDMSPGGFIEVQPTEGGALTEAERDMLGAAVIGGGVMGTVAAVERILDQANAAAAAQRPEGVTVTEVGIIRTPDDSGSSITGEPEWHSEQWMNTYGWKYRRHVSRQRTTFADVVTEWAEVSGDTETGGERG